MTLVLWIFTVASVLLALAGSVVPGLPGPPLILVAGVLWWWLGPDGAVGKGTVVILGVVTGLSFALDFLAGAIGARRFGASKAGIVGAVVGCIVGLPFGLFGILLGPLLGSLIAELIVGHDIQSSTKAAFGTFIGLVAGSVIKVGLTIAMIVLLLVDLVR